jgi:hypothetical protein
MCVWHMSVGGQVGSGGRGGGTRDGLWSAGCESPRGGSGGGGGGTVSGGPAVAPVELGGGEDGRMIITTH